SGSVGCPIAQVQDAGGLGVFDVASPRGGATEVAGSDPQLRAVGATAIYAGIARRLGGYGQELGRPGCADASRAVGLAGCRALRKGSERTRSGCLLSRRLRPPGDAGGPEARGLRQSSPGASADES